MIFGNLLLFIFLLGSVASLNLLNLNGLANIFGLNSLLSSVNEEPSETARNIMLSFPSINGPILKAAQELKFPSRKALIEAVTMALRVATLDHQAQALDMLDLLNFDYQSFWITNKVLVQNVSPDMVSVLAALPGVLSAVQEINLPMLKPVNLGNAPDPNGEPVWGVKKMNAPAVWSKNKANGQGVTVGVIDTGVRGSHKCLKENFLGTNGWYDPVAGTAAPTDTHGHGTHCTGTIAGSGGIGVAPGCRWMACVGCTTAGCPEAALVSCGQFMTIPTDTSGENPDASKTPDVVSCSWGGGQGSDFYNDVLELWKFFGILGVFAIGNSGPNCGTANSPGDQTGKFDHVSVGATGPNDEIPSFSGRGPSVEGKRVPELMAPGSNVVSASHLSDSSFQKMSGTSMATPHVAGALAVLLSFNKNMKPQEAKKALVESCFQNLNTDVTSCSGTSTKGNYPNAVAGFGRADLQKAASTLQSMINTNSTNSNKE